MMARSVFLIGALWLVLASACDQGEGVVRGDTLALSDCDEGGVWSPFEMELVYLSVLRASDAVVMRASVTPELPDVSDSLTITIASYDDVMAALDADGVAVLTVDSGAVSLGLTLLASCPESTTPLVGSSGSMTFYEFGTHTGDRVRGDLSFQLKNARTGEAVGSGFEGAIDFEILAGTPYEAFSDLPRQHGE